MIKAIVIDDELPNIELVKLFVNRYCPDVDIIDTADNVPDAIEKIIKGKPELLFLDIEIHDQNAFDLLNALTLDHLQVILVTSHSQYALQAIKYSIVDYVLKPIAIPELIAAVNKAKIKIEEKRLLLKSKNQPYTATMIALPGKEDHEVSSVHNIIRLEAKGSYTSIFTNDNKVHLVTKKLKELEAQLPKEQFLRVHASHIINLNYVNKLIKSRNNHLIMKDNASIPVSLAHKIEVSQRIVY